MAPDNVPDQQDFIDECRASIDAAAKAVIASQVAVLEAWQGLASAQGDSAAALEAAEAALRRCSYLGPHERGGRADDIAIGTQPLSCRSSSRACGGQDD